MNAPKVMPCGWRRTGKLKEHLAHYRACQHPACQERVSAWNALVIEARKSLVIRPVDPTLAPEGARV